MSISGAEATVIAGGIAAGAAVLGGLIGTFGTLWATDRSVSQIELEGDRQREADAIQRQADRDHQWALAVEQTRQEKLLEAYTQTQTYVAGWSNFAEWRTRIYETEPPAPVPEIPKLGERDIALASLLVSPEVDALLTQFTTRIQYFRIAIGELESLDPNADAGLPAAVEDRDASRIRLKTSAERLVEAGERVYKQMQQELLRMAT